MGNNAVYAGILLLFGVFTAAFFFDSVPGMADATITRDLPEHAYPGETITVALTFDLPEEQAVTVDEEMTADGTAWSETVSVSSIEAGRIVYETSIPEAATGTVRFAGTVQEFGTSVSGDDTVTVVTEEDGEHTPPDPAAVLPETVNGFGRQSLSATDGPARPGNVTDTVSATYTADGAEHTVTVEQFATVDGSYDALLSVVEDRETQLTTVNTENAYRIDDSTLMWDQNEFLYTVTGPDADTLADHLHEVHIDAY